MFKKLKSTFQKSLRTKRKVVKWLAYIRDIKPVASFQKLPTPLAPDYSDLKNWAAHPSVNDKSNFTRIGVEPSTQLEADVFFIHPTTFFGNQYWNSPLEKGSAKELIDEMIMPEQASVFNGCCRVFAPRYRQATFYSFLENSKNGQQALELAYDDVRKAFEYYLEKENNGRPFFISGHSQGTVHGIRLLEDFVENGKIFDQFVAAYLIGFRFPMDKFEKSFQRIRPANEADDIKCVIAYDTYLKSGAPGHRLDFATHWYDGQWERRAWKKVLTINPLNWSRTKDRAIKHEGAVHTTFEGKGISMRSFMNGEAIGADANGLSRIYKNEVEAFIKEDSFLYVTPPKSRIFGRVKMPKGNLHLYDYSLFYMNLRNNIIKRLTTYQSQL